MSFAIKVAIGNPAAKSFVFTRQKTMYGGKHIRAGDTIYVFASENEGGPGLVARGIVAEARSTPRMPGVARQTPRVSIEVRRIVKAARRLGRAELKPFKNWKDGRAESELNFKFYRQATNKVVGLSEIAANFLDGFFKSKARLRRTHATARARARRR